MRIGFSVSLSNPLKWRSKTWDRFYQDEIDLAVYGESLGFDTCWVYEGHFIGHDEGHGSSPMTVCAAIAARTKRIEVGSNLILAFHDPVLIAEAAATIDLISGGRFVLGVVQGYRNVEYAGFGISTKERGTRVSEGIDIIRRSWEGERFSYSGKHWSYSDIEPHPLPARPGGPPIFYGARSEAALRRAARDRVGIISQGEGMEAPVYFAQQCAELGNEPGEVRHLRYLWVAEDPERDWAEVRQHCAHLVAEYDSSIRDAGDPGLHGLPAGSEAEIEDELLRSDMFIVGTPEHCVKRLLELKAQYPSVAEFWHNFHYPGLTSERVAACMELYASKVMPRLKTEAVHSTSRANV